MGRNKKRKRDHLTEEEIWDDSALLQSWQDAVDEYEFYHSIHASGEDVNEVLRQAELEEAVESKEAESKGNGAPPSGSALEDGEISEPNSSDLETAEKDEHATNIPEMNRFSKPKREAQSTKDDKDRQEILENMKMPTGGQGTIPACMMHNKPRVREREMIMRGKLPCEGSDAYVTLQSGLTSVVSSQISAAVRTVLLTQICRGYYLMAVARLHELFTPAGESVAR